MIKKENLYCFVYFIVYITNYTKKIDFYSNNALYKC